MNFEFTDPSPLAYHVEDDEDIPPLIEILRFASIFEHQFFHYFKFIPFCRRYVIQWNKNYNTSHFFVNEISVFQHKFHQQFFRQTSRRSRRHHELFVENKMLQKLHTYMHHNTPILIHFQQDWCFSIFKPNFFLSKKAEKCNTEKSF